MNPRALRTAAAVSLALGLAFALALASIADALLFRPLPVPRARELQRVFTSTKEQPFGLLSSPDFEDLRAHGRMIAQSQILVAVAQAILSPADSAVAQAILSPANSPPQVRLGLAVSPDYFQNLGLAPALGRAFSDDDHDQPVVILAHSCWESHFGSDPHILGRTLRLATTPFTIVGVAPRGFGLDRFLHEDFYVPLGVYRRGLLPAQGHPLEERGRRFLTVFARDISLAQLDATAARLAEQYPETNRGRRILALPELDAYAQLYPGTATLARTVAVIAALILLIATANAAGLLLLAAEARTREMTIRSALGASPLRLFCERLRETVSSTALAALASLPLAWLVTRLLLDVARPPTDIPLVPLARIDPGLLLPIVAAALLTVAASFFRHVPRSLVAAFQIALATALAVLGVNLAASLRDAQHTALGFRTDHILTLTFDPAQLRFTEAQTRRFYVDLLERVRMLPGVRSAALAQSIPMGYASAQHNIATGGDSPSTAVFSNVVSPGYFDLMRIPILEGRAIDDRDTSTSPPVTVVNQELARVAPINSILLVNGRRHTVVGVARTARYFHLAEAPRAFLYLSFGQNYASRMTLHVATESAPAQLARAVVAQARLLDPDLPATDVRPLDDSVWQSALVHIRTALRAVELVGCCGLVLALAGLYAVVASAALRRRREIAIRIAIGSSRARVCTLVLRPAAILSIAAVIVGWVLAALARRLLGSMLPPSSGDSLTAAFAASTVLMLSLLAALLPAARVFRVDPATVLRKE